MPHSHRHHHDVSRGIIDSMAREMDKQVGRRRWSRDKKEADGAEAGGEATVFHTVYKTLDPTFEGPVAGYSTLNQDAAPEATQAAATAEAPRPTKEVATKPAHSSEVQESTSIPTAIRLPLTASGLDTVLAQATGDPTLSQSTGLGIQSFTSTPIRGAAPTTTSASPSTTPEDSGHDTSAGSKAGIAFGVLGGVFIVGLVAFFLFNRRRRQAAAALGGADNEKHPRNNDAFETMTVRSDLHAPRISLRPVTQFLPNWSLDKRTSKGAGTALTPAGVSTNANGQRNGVRDRPVTSQSTHPGNPFGGQAERLPEPTIPEHGAIPASDPFTANGPPVVAAGAAAGALSRKTSIRNGGPSKLDTTVPPALAPMAPSPAHTEFSTTSVSPSSAVFQPNGGAAIVTAGGTRTPNVHRVQLDFEPSLEDEMEMRAGELVRLLHEYDDGWALCIRLDRSQQGVVPRTCLSTRPVKPRSPEGASRLGPPVNPSGQFSGGSPQRPVTPQSRVVTPQSLPQDRPLMGPGRPESPGPDPMKPPFQRAPSPGPQCDGPSPDPPVSRPRSPTAAPRQLDGLAGASPIPQAESPPSGPSHGPPTGPVGRKPVPGQAY
ncbi:hypothetical protein E4U41_002650 [Claviceps citrina]|nr:hypothetical protein E4U41_002650 [Claviceps citrina]